jgi:hypothetical protein
MAGPWMNDAAQDNRYQYNGKELNDDFGLGWNDHGARRYEPREAEPSRERIVVGLESIAPAWEPYMEISINGQKTVIELFGNPILK